MIRVWRSGFTNMLFYSLRAKKTSLRGHAHFLAAARMLHSQTPSPRPVFILWAMLTIAARTDQQPAPKAKARQPKSKAKRGIQSDEKSNQSYKDKSTDLYGNNIC